MAGDVRQVGVLQLKTRIPEQAGEGHLDDPDPEAFAAHAGAVQIHQHRLQRPVDGHRMNGIVGRVAQRRTHVGLRPPGEGDELDLAVAGRRHRSDAVLPHPEEAIATRRQRHQAVIRRELAQAGNHDALAH